MVDVSDPKLTEAYNAVRTDSDDTNWLVFGYTENNKAIELQGTGSGGLEELLQQFKPDQSQYGYCALITGDEESKRTKFILLSWCGTGVGALKRAKMSVHKASVKQVLKEFASEFHGETLEDLNVDDIRGKVVKSGGADYSGNKSH